MVVCGRCSTDTSPDEILTTEADGIDGCRDCVGRCASCNELAPRDGGSTYNHAHGDEWYCDRCSETPVL